VTTITPLADLTKNASPDVEEPNAAPSFVASTSLPSPPPSSSLAPPGPSPLANSATAIHGPTAHARFVIFEVAARATRYSLRTVEDEGRVAGLALSVARDRLSSPPSSLP
jgi:hypothetical protein